jgi:uncharacterized protein (TIGR02145 family)
MCPDPWRVPTQSDISTLTSYFVNNDEDAYDVLAAAWGFDGYAVDETTMLGINEGAWYWSITTYDATEAYALRIWNDMVSWSRGNKSYGYQVRCVN